MTNKNNNILRALYNCISIFTLFLHSSILHASENSVYLNKESIQDHINCTDTECFFPLASLTNKNIVVENNITWDNKKNLTLHTKGNIIFKKNAKITSKKNILISLKSGMEPGKTNHYDGNVIFEGDSVQVKTPKDGRVRVYFNPDSENGAPKYHYLDSYDEHIETGKLISYMLVNDIHDLQNVRFFLPGNYALSQDIDAEDTKNLDDKKGFKPLQNKDTGMPFSGNFDGNNYTIHKLLINRPDENETGLFGNIVQHKDSTNTIENIVLKNPEVTGNRYVGCLAGFIANTNLFNIKILNPKLKGTTVVGTLAGTTDAIYADNIEISDNAEITSPGTKGFIVGGAGKGEINLLMKTTDCIKSILGNYDFIGNDDSQTIIYLSDKIDHKEISLLGSDTTSNNSLLASDHDNSQKIFSDYT